MTAPGAPMSWYPNDTDEERRTDQPHQVCRECRQNVPIWYFMDDIVSGQSIFVSHDDATGKVHRFEFALMCVPCRQRCVSRASFNQLVSPGCVIRKAGPDPIYLQPIYNYYSRKPENLHLTSEITERHLKRTADKAFASPLPVERSDPQRQKRRICQQENVRIPDTGVDSAMNVSV